MNDNEEEQNPQQISRTATRKRVLVSVVVIFVVTFFHLDFSSFGWNCNGNSYCPHEKLQQQQHQQEPHQTLVRGHPSNMSSLLSFSIIGFPKTGTSFLLSWLRSHSGICMPPNELRTWKSQNGDPIAETTNVLLSLSSNQTTTTRSGNDSHLGVPPPCTVRGYKSPSQVRNAHALKVLSNEWPSAKFIVGVRHPVSWFESLYNFKVGRGVVSPVLPGSNRTLLDEVIKQGRCRFNICPHNGKFHLFLSYFGKTPLLSEEEVSLFLFDNSTQGGWAPWSRKYVQSPPLPNRIFLYDLAQMDWSNHPSTFDQLRQDLSQFLGLPPSMSLRRPEGAKSISHDNRDSSILLDICEPQYEEFRLELLDIGSKAAKWILEYFVHSPDVTVSSPEFFEQQLHQWEYDPCNGVVPGTSNRKGN